MGVDRKARTLGGQALQRANRARPGAGLRLATVGTSLVDNNVYVSAAGKQFGHSARGWLPWARFYSKGRIDHPVWYDTTVYEGWEPSSTPGATRGHQGLNFGVAGQTAPQIIARLPFIGQHYLDRFDAVVVDAGTNEMMSDGKEEILANRQTIARYFLERGKAVILLPILGRGVSAWPSGSAQRKRAHWINAASRAWAINSPNCFWYDWNQAWVDGTSADGTPRSGYSDDGTHFALPGGEAVGYDFATNFLPTLFPQAQPRVLSQDDLFDVGDNPFGNYLANGLFTGTSGGHGAGSSGSGGVASGWQSARSSGTSTVVASKEARADGRGYWQVLTYAPSGAGSDEMLYLQTSADIAHDGAAWLQGSCEVEVNGGEGLSGITLYLRDTGTNGWIAQDMLAQPSPAANAVWPARARSGLLQTPPLQIAPGNTQVRFRIEVRLRGASGVAPVVKVGAAELRRVDDPRPAGLRA